MTREESKTVLTTHRDHWERLLSEGICDACEGRETIDAFTMAIKALEQGSKIGHCKDCKWWKDSDGAYRRGVGAESQCPINRQEVYQGIGYCYMFELLKK